MLYGAEVAVYSEVSTERINTVWAERTDVELDGPSRNH